MKSQTPTWAIITGILMMLIGGCGIKNDIQSINIRELLSMKDKIIDNVLEDREHRRNTNHDTLDNQANDTLTNQSLVDEDMEEDSDTMVVSESNEDMSADSIDDEKDEELDKVEEIFGKFMDVPEETINLIIKFGYIGLFFSFLLVLGGLFLLIKKSFSIKLAYAVLGANILFSLVRWIFLSGKGGGLLAISNSLSAAFGILACVVIGIIIFSSDKSHFEDTYIEEQ